MPYLLLGILVLVLSAFVFVGFLLWLFERIARWQTWREGRTLRKTLAIALLLTLALTGCTTTTTNGTTTKTVDPAVLQVVSQEAAAVGTTLWLQQHPEQRPAFETARASLKILLAGGTGNAADLQTALASLPVKELQGTGGSIIVSSAAILLGTAGQQITAHDSRNVWAGYVKPVATGLVAGLDQALGQ